MKELIKGQKIKLGDITPATRLEIGVGIAHPSAVIDFSCFGLDIHGRLSDDRYLIFYNQKLSPCGSLVVLGSQGEDKERFRIDLAHLPQTIRRLVFTATIDGQGTIAQMQWGHLRILANGSEVARYNFEGSDFTSEKAIVIGEVYFKDVWRVGAVGQGFAGGLSALLKHFGGEEITSSQSLAMSAQPSHPPARQTPAASLQPDKAVSLEKKLEQQAPQLLSLVKKVKVSLQKVGLSDHCAKVALCLDISASMSSLYKSGKIQRLAEKILALGCRFDDNAAIDIFLFGANAHVVGELSVDNFGGYVDRIIKQYALEGGTYYGKVMQEIRSFYFPQGKGKERTKPSTADLPTYVMFVTDGATFDQDVTEQQLKWSSYEPIFWQFMAIGKSHKDVKSGGLFGAFKKIFTSNFAFLEKLDTMGGRYIDNANFFSVEDPEMIPDEELYDLLMGEYPSWLKLAREKKLLKS